MPAAPMSQPAGRERFNYGFNKVERLQGNVGYLEIGSFANLDEGKDTASTFLSALANFDSIIVDLRQNGGGNTPMAAYEQSRARRIGRGPASRPTPHAGPLLARMPPDEDSRRGVDLASRNGPLLEPVLRAFAPAPPGDRDAVRSGLSMPARHRQRHVGPFLRPHRGLRTG
jgi:Peptidase family S41